MIYLLSFALLLSGCASTTIENSSSVHDESAISKSKNLIAQYEYNSAVKVLETFQSEHPLSPNMAYVEKLLIECYAQTSDYPMLIAAADRFLYEHMEDANRDYVAYLRFNAISKQAQGYPYEWLPIDRSTRDISRYKDAFMAGKSFIRTYPNSVYAPNVAHSLPFLKETIARHYFLKGELLSGRREYIGSVKNYQSVLSDFADTSYAPLAKNALDTFSSSLTLQETIVPS